MKTHTLNTKTCKWVIVGNAEQSSYKYTELARQTAKPTKRQISAYSRRWYNVRYYPLDSDIVRTDYTD
jgi:hypothetical protein